MTNLKNSNKKKTQIVTKLKNSYFDKNKKKSNCEKAQKLKCDNLSF